MNAIIFDLDGTLWDTSDTVVDIWNKVLSVRCPKLKMTKEIMSSLMGKNKAQFVDDFFVDVEKDEAEMLINEIFKCEQEHLRSHGAELYDNVLETLEKLKNDYALMIVSNCQQGYLNSFLEYYKLKDLLSDYECAGSTGFSKGENIKLVMKRNDIGKAIYVGDTKSDECAAREAGVPFVYASYGFGKSDKYDATLNSFKEIKYVAKELLI
ncbi:MAG: HAD family hydrolase [Ruminococcaceae bacterium]|nr:HAD family hydrolase [Oscillospiraceae bacterium]